jgi:hypothetical protein
MLLMSKLLLSALLSVDAAAVRACNPLPYKTPFVPHPPTRAAPLTRVLSPEGLSGCRMEPLQLLSGRASAPTSSLLPQMRAVDSGRVGLLLRSCSRCCQSSSPCAWQCSTDESQMCVT